jgi:hypothetical protein
MIYYDQFPNQAAADFLSLKYKQNPGLEIDHRNLHANQHIDEILTFQKP